MFYQFYQRKMLSINWKMYAIYYVACSRFTSTNILVDPGEGQEAKSNEIFTLHENWTGTGTGNRTATI